MKIKYLIIIGIVLLLGSCTGKRSGKDFGSVKTIDVDMSKSHPMDVSNTQCLKKIIPLESLTESLVSNIEKIYLTDSLVIIFDNRMKNILLFDSAGKFLRTIGVKGNGPGEYISYNDVCFDKNMSLIYAHDLVKQIMFVYSVSGKLIQEIPTTKFMFRSFCKVNDGYWIYSCYETGNPKGYSIMKVDNNFEEQIRGYLPQKKFFRTTIHSTFLQNTKNENFFLSPFSNVIYKLIQDSIVPVFQINFGGKTIPYSKIPELTDEQAYDRLVYNKGYFGEIGNVVFTLNSLFFSFSEMSNESRLYLANYNYKSKSVDVYDQFAEYKSLNIGEDTVKHLTLTTPIGATQAGIIYTVQPHDLSEETLAIFRQKLKIPVDVEANPILLILENKK